MDIPHEISDEVAEVGGQIEWRTEHGVGVKVSHKHLRDDQLCLLTHTIRDAVSLDFSESGITDNGLRQLTSAQSLESLNLSGTSVTVRGLRYLAGLPKLVEVHMIDTGITDVDIKNLNEVMPGIKIFRERAS